MAHLGSFWNDAGEVTTLEKLWNQQATKENVVAKIQEASSKRVSVSVSVSVCVCVSELAPFPPWFNLKPEGTPPFQGVSLF